eukprot:CAMPEP_0114588150 /NCGR_PEP_ID=MMETSP0125-20121206/10924_1 /TAXON_ID=485358 ORGANISM="Aristerostoma sp., Strain ATCC 50986" /NCGR_SAMPLE_ID=MMETSP0125 /ASSEMBLY_ACC=CAM_ASM_000245 /LENGTH=53 /DNA_ID=CAMNT_0001784401 /DNA_START=2481 /DNA_END=2642 /DNA_ORIENTATION=-
MTKGAIAENRRRKGIILGDDVQNQLQNLKKVAAGDSGSSSSSRSTSPDSCSNK